MTATDRTWVGEARYVFELPLRLAHWTIFFSVMVLSATGYWIGSGNLPAGSDGPFQMGWIRYVHTATGWVFASAILLRIYLFFRGNEYARWTDFIPYRKEHLRDLKEIFFFYTFARVDYPEKGYGHNRLAALTYLVVYLLLLAMAVSGLALHGMAFSFGWQSWLAWPLAIVPAPRLRLFHHMGMWLIWGFVVHHVTSAVLADRERRGGLLGGIFSGYKFIPTRVKR
jgi:Ni/Fe-hydrogenase 1 B-type cytochrome subunit